MDIGDDFDFGVGDSLNLNLDFDLLDESPQTQIMSPKISRPVAVKYKNAQETAAQMTLKKGMNYYAVLSGAFIMGDIFEAWAERHKVRSLHVATLGMNPNNVDSLVNCIRIHGVEQVSLIVSHYFFGVERHRMIRYIAEEIAGLPFRVAVAGSHCKIALMEADGLFVTLHGSANLSSNNNIEQISVTEGRELYDFNREIFDGIFKSQTIIDGSKIDYKPAKGAASKKTWEAITDGKG